MKTRDRKPFQSGREVLSYYIPGYKPPRHGFGDADAFPHDGEVAAPTTKPILNDVTGAVDRLEAALAR